MKNPDFAQKAGIDDDRPDPDLLQRDQRDDLPSPRFQRKITQGSGTGRIGRNLNHAAPLELADTQNAIGQRGEDLTQGTIQTEDNFLGTVRTD